MGWAELQTEERKFRSESCHVSGRWERRGLGDNWTLSDLSRQRDQSSIFKDVSINTNQVKLLEVKETNQLLQDNYSYCIVFVGKKLI